MTKTFKSKEMQEIKQKLKAEVCPKCGKKGLHSRKGNNVAIDNCITPSYAYSCRYCDYHESSIDNMRRLGK